jgi:hypothetical protein
VTAKAQTTSRRYNGIGNRRGGLWIKNRKLEHLVIDQLTLVVISYDLDGLRNDSHGPANGLELREDIDVNAPAEMPVRTHLKIALPHTEHKRKRTALTSAAGPSSRSTSGLRLQ